MAAMDRPVARGLLLIGIAIVVLNAFLLVALYGPMAHRDGPMFVEPPDAFPLVLVPILGFAASLFGLWRMWRVWRGSH
jgi:hypothetical protein